MELSGIGEILSHLRAQAARAVGDSAPGDGPDGASAVDFAGVFKEALGQVNKTQQQAEQLAQQFELGAPDVALHDVMISLQKAQISLQTAVQVRNKVLSAYHDIMNMQV